MEFRRIPFQFTSTDPAKRNAQLQKRFGLPKEKMYLDFANPSYMGSGKKEPSSASCSPRLQHRVPIFVEGSSEPVKSSVEVPPVNVDSGQKPRVRVVPIEIENPDGSKRHRTLSGSTFINDKPFQNGYCISEDVKPDATVTTSKSANAPRVYNIPIKIEDDKKLKAKTPPMGQKEQMPKSTTPIKNGCNVSKTRDQEKVAPQPDYSISFKKIETVLEKLKSYQADVEKFSGTVKEKQYRYLDEMLTRLMLDLDDVETMGNEKIRLNRKAAIKKVQYCIDLLESKVCGGSQTQTESNTDSCEEMMPVQFSEEKPEVVADKDSVEGAVEQNEFNADSCEEMIVQSEENIEAPIVVSGEGANSVDQQVSSIDGNQIQTECSADSCEEMMSAQSEEKTEVTDMVSVENPIDLNVSDKSSEPLTRLEENSVVAEESEMLVESTEMESDLQQVQSMETDDIVENMPVVETDELVAELEKDDTIQVESCDNIVPESLTVIRTVDIPRDQMGRAIEIEENNDIVSSDEAIVTSVSQDIDYNNTCDLNDVACDRTKILNSVEAVDVSSTAADSCSVHSKESNEENTSEHCTNVSEQKSVVNSPP